MQRVLIADTTEAFTSALYRQLKDVYAVKVCSDSQKAMELIESFDPDVLVLDLSLPGEDWLCRLRAIRAAGNTADILLTSTYYSDYVLAQLPELNISCPMRKPCSVNTTLAHIRQLMFRRLHPDDKSWCVENEMENLLLVMGFRPGPKRFNTVREAVMYKYIHPNCAITKEIYPALARKLGGSDTKIEKAIRDAVSDAYDIGDKALWRAFFIPRKPPKPPYPSNEEFIARIAISMHQKTRIRKPYRLWLDKAE